MDLHFERPNGSRRRIIALEFNELCPALLDKWMADGTLPNFACLHAQSSIFTTRPDVTDPALLEPWIQWYSLHTGLSYDQHGVFHLTEGARAGHADIFRMLLDAGRHVASFASMNLAPFAASGSVFVADPWSDTANASPPQLNLYNRFISHNVREYSNASDRMGAGDYAKFLAFMLRHGLRPATVARIAAQLASEKLGVPRRAYRRVALLDALQFDLFRSYYRAERFDFASFFSNSVAHLQHSYWRHMAPEAFTVRPDAGEMAAYGDAIRFGYQATDRLLGKFLKLAKAEGATLVFMTALSQQPFLRHEEMGGQHFHRLHDVRGFMVRMGIACESVDPTMTHQYLAQFASVAQASAAQERLSALGLADGRPIFDFPPISAQPGSLYFGCQISARTARDTPVIDAQGNSTIPFGELFYQIEAIKSGRHHPDGCLWIQTGQHRAHAEQPSILDVLPTLMDLLAAPMSPGAYAGKSLAPLLAA